MLAEHGNGQFSVSVILTTIVAIVMISGTLIKRPTMRRCPASITFVVAAACVTLVSAGRVAHAQAWVADQGKLEVSLGYNLGVSDEVVVDKGEDAANAGSTTHELTLAAEYVPLQHLAVDVALPFELLKYTGDKNAFPHPGGGRYDDGSLHSTLTDLRVGARYQVLEDIVALTPMVAVSIPVASYETVGNTVAGRHLKALHLGLALGHIFGESTYVQAVYQYSIVEKYDRTMDTGKYGQNRSDFNATVGHKLLDQRLDIHIDAIGRVTHDGINFSDFTALPADDQLYHDPILKERILLVGGGVGYQLTEDLGINAGAHLFVTGANTQNANVYDFGITWTAL
ncbi:MAG TPA: transporter [Kofleriaceae bacterium]